MRLIRLLKTDLAHEVASWVDKDLISKDQARVICNEYDMDFDRLDESAKGYKVLVALGYLFIGLAAIVLIGGNWDAMPRELRLFGVLAVTTITHGLGIRAMLRDQVASATGLFFLGNLFYGASIILIAQIYHLGEHMPDGVFWWALGCLPFGVLLRSTWLTLLSLLLALLGAVLEFDMGFFPVLLPVFLLAALYVLVKSRANNLFFLMLVFGILLWLQMLLTAYWSSSYDLGEVKELFFVGAAVFILVYAISGWLNLRQASQYQDYGALLSLWTLRLALITLFVLSYDDVWRELIHYHWQEQRQIEMWCLVGTLLFVALVIGFKLQQLPTLLPLVMVLLLTMVLVVNIDDVTYSLYFVVAYNIVFIASAIGLVIKGLHAGVSHYFFLGVASILLVALIRYIDLVGGYIGGAMLFFVLAVLLLGAAKFWRYQKANKPPTKQQEAGGGA